MEFVFDTLLISLVFLVVYVGFNFFKKRFYAQERMKAKAKLTGINKLEGNELKIDFRILNSDTIQVELLDGDFNPLKTLITKKEFTAGEYFVKADLNEFPNADKVKFSHSLGFFETKIV
jgi:hypothetical protein